jgi:hypothetical protein
MALVDSRRIRQGIRSIGSICIDDQKVSIIALMNASPTDPKKGMSLAHTLSDRSSPARRQVIGQILLVSRPFAGRSQLSERVLLHGWWLSSPPKFRGRSEVVEAGRLGDLEGPQDVPLRGREFTAQGE